MAGRPLPESWASEGSAIRRAIVAEFAAVEGVQVIETVDARCLDERLESQQSTRIVADSAPVDLGASAKLADASIVVAPETDGELARLAELVERAGGRSLGSTPEAIALCGCKLRMARHFAEVGVPTPPTQAFSPASGLPWVDSPSGRVVVKPVDGAGSVATFVLGASSPCPPEWSRRSVALIQPFRPGRSLSASFLVGLDGRAKLLAVGSQRVEVGGQGQVRYLGGEVPVSFSPLDLAPVRKAVESVPGLFGFVGVDFLDSGEGVEVLEINPRLTTSIVGLVRLAPPGTIARAWLGLAFEASDGKPENELEAIRSASPVRFGADGSILGTEAGR